MADRFEECLTFVLKWEGGFSNDPDDPGGATNLGIIQTEYDHYRLGHGEDRQSVAKITHEEAADIYRNNYWIPTHGQFLAQPIDLTLFDTAVNNGLGTALGFLQASLGVPITHAFDAMTSSAYHDYISAHPASKLAQSVLDARAARYRHLVELHPKLGKFLKGWMNRVAAVRATF